MADNIGDWLEKLGLGKYAPVFVENEIDLDTLPYVTDEALDTIGVALGARLKILAAIGAQSTEDIAADTRIEDKTELPSHLRGAERRQLTVLLRLRPFPCWAREQSRVAMTLETSKLTRR